MTKKRPSPSPPRNVNKAYSVNRSRLLARLQALIERRGHPRTYMLGAISLTALAGFFSSMLLLRLGFVQMGTRYVLALLCAYLVFILLMWIWINMHRKGKRGGNGSFDLPDLQINLKGNSVPRFRGGGGEAGGGGSSGSFGEPDGARDSSVSKLGAIADFDFDELLAVILVVLAIAGAVLTSFYFLWTAPQFLAELLLDGVVGASLYRRMRNVEHASWFDTLLKRTARPMVALLILFGAAGYAMQHYAPDAVTIGDAWEQYQLKQHQKALLEKFRRQY